MLGGDLIHSAPRTDRPVPGRALVLPRIGTENAELLGLEVRFVDDDGEVVTHELELITPTDHIPAVASWGDIIVVLASHPGDINTAIDTGRVSGWLPVAQSPSTTHDRTGYAIGVGISQN